MHHIMFRRQGHSQCFHRVPLVRKKVFHNSLEFEALYLMTLLVGLGIVLTPCWSSGLQQVEA